MEKEITLWSDLEKRNGDVEVLLEFAESGDAELEEVSTELKAYTKIIEDVELQMILGDEQDSQDAIVTITPALEALKAKTGRKCFIVCIHAGLSRRVLEKYHGLPAR